MKKIYSGDVIIDGFKWRKKKDKTQIDLKSYKKLYKLLSKIGYNPFEDFGYSFSKNDGQWVRKEEK